MHQRTRKKNRSSRRMRGGNGSCGSGVNQTIGAPVDIIFSHNARIKCIIQQVKRNYPDANKGVSECEPDNGGIVVIVDSGKKGNEELSVFYHTSQLKLPKPNQTATCSKGDAAQLVPDLKHFLSDKLNIPLSPIRQIYIFVRHGWGWHNASANKKTKINPFYSSSTTQGEGWDSNLYDDPTDDSKNGFQDAVKAGKTLGQVLATINTITTVCIKALLCSDLQRTAETGNIAVFYAKKADPNIKFPEEIIVLPCNHELPKGTCEGGMVSMKSGSTSWENETSLPDAEPDSRLTTIDLPNRPPGPGKLWGKTFGPPNNDQQYLVRDNSLPYDFSAYYQFYSGARKTGIRSGVRDRQKCHDFPFPRNVEWALKDRDARRVWAQGVKERKVKEKKSWWGGRKTRQAKRRRRRRVKVSLCKKKTFHKCKSRKARR